MKTSRAFTVMIGLQVLILMGQWLGTSVPTTARAQIPDSGAQRNQMVEELKNIDAKFDKLLTLLGDGKLQVRVSASDDKRADH